MVRKIEVMGYLSQWNELVTLLGPDVYIPIEELAYDMEVSCDQVYESIRRAEGKGYVVLFGPVEDDGRTQLRKGAFKENPINGVRLSHASWLQSQRCYTKPLLAFRRASRS